MTKKSFISREDVKEIIRLYTEEKVSVINIAKQYKCDKRRIKGILEEESIVPTGNKTVLDESTLKSLIDDYIVNMLDLNTMSEKYHMGKPRIKKILTENNIELRVQGWQNVNPNKGTFEYTMDKYKPIEGKHYIAKCKTTDYSTTDYLNKMGTLSKYIREEMGIDVPSAYEMRKYFQYTGDYWWEQYFDIVAVDSAKVVFKCPYCDFEITEDNKNPLNSLRMHLTKTHNMAWEDFFKEHPEYIEQFKYADERRNIEFEQDESKFVQCPICGKKMKSISRIHLETHGITVEEFIKKYGTELLEKDLRENSRTLAEEEIASMIEDYTKYDYSLMSLGEKYKVGVLKIKDIFNDRNVEITKKGGHSNTYATERFKEVEGKKYVAVCKVSDFSTEDYVNFTGVISQYLKDYFNIEAPSLLEQKEYIKNNGRYWWEEYFNILLVDKPMAIKKCPYCDFEITEDVNYPTISLFNHMRRVHNISSEEYFKLFPEDIETFKLANKTNILQYEQDESKFVTCQICGKKLRTITAKHLALHNITPLEYDAKFGFGNRVSEETHNILHDISIKTNMNMPLTKTYTSKDEAELLSYIRDNLGIECDKTRALLGNGKELDIYIPSKNVAIEYNGCKWHTEWFGHKAKYGHIEKTLQCESKGIQLLQIFEDEYNYHKEIVLKKIEHILHISRDCEKIPARKCEIRNIEFDEASKFLNKNHIQGEAFASVYLGAFYNNRLVAVMTFKLLENETDNYELNRFASDINCICQGIGGKLFKHFVRTKNPSYIVSFADRRWSIHTNDNLYVKLGFKFDGYTNPNYTYYNEKVDRYKRYHKFGFRKQLLNKKYGFSMDMTETEMVQSLGFDRIWDCGLIKYTWGTKPKKEITEENKKEEEV